MSQSKPIRRIGIIGTGVIGASWTALYLAKGLQVVATDIAPNAEAALHKFVDTAWPALKRLGLSPGASQAKRLPVHPASWDDLAPTSTFVSTSPLIGRRALNADAASTAS